LVNGAVSHETFPAFSYALGYLTGSIWDQDTPKSGGDQLPSTTILSNQNPSTPPSPQRKRYISKDEEDFLEILSDVVSSVPNTPRANSPRKRFPSISVDYNATPLENELDISSNPHESEVVDLIDGTPSYEEYVRQQQKRMACTRSRSAMATELDMWAHDAIKHMRETLEDSTDVGTLSPEEFNARMRSLDLELTVFESVMTPENLPEPGAPEMEICGSTMWDRHPDLRTLFDEGDTKDELTANTSESSSSFDPDSSEVTPREPAHTLRYTTPLSSFSREKLKTAMKTIVAQNLELVRENEELKRRLKWVEKNNGGERLPLFEEKHI